MLIFAQQPEATRIASYTTWKSLGRNVRKGEKGISILAPCRYRVEERESEKVEVGVSWKLKGFKVGYVFDISQTDGEPIEEASVTQLLEGNAPDGMWDSLHTLIERDGYSVSRADCGAANWFTDRAAQKVVVAPHLSDAAAAKTLTHELAHVRQDSAHVNSVSRSLCEVEAESVAFVVCSALGLNSAPYSIGYVAGWAGATCRTKRRRSW
jgi:antirestriction protein ArdC